MGNAIRRGVKRLREEDEEVQVQVRPPPPLTSASYSVEMLVQRNHKELVLHIMRNGSQNNHWMSELRLFLFMAAANDAYRDSYLLPFPACCFDRETKQKNFDLIWMAIAEVPELTNIDEATIMSPFTWELLYWVLTNPSSLEPLTENIESTIQQMRIRTKLNLPIPDNMYTWLFIVKQTQPKPKFAKAKAKYGSFYAFHGSSVRTFHAIIHRGLISSYNRVVSRTFGYGTYMAPVIETSLDYAYWGTGWARSAFGQYIRCIAVVEVVAAPKVRNLHRNYCYVCPNDDYMQLSHLYVFRY